MAPPPTGLHRLYALPFLAGRPQGVPRKSLLLPPLIRLPPICRRQPAPRYLSDPGVLLSEGPLLPLPTFFARMSDTPPA